MLHPFGKEMAALFESCEGRCVDPEDSQGWFESAEWSAWRAQFAEGVSSKDGLHHMYLKSHIITMNQATLSLSLASMGRSNFDLSWLDHLPAPDDPKLLDSMCSGGFTFANLRVLIAEVLEWQGQHKKAIRCAHQLFYSLFRSLSFTPSLYIYMPYVLMPFRSCSITALRLLSCKTNSTSTQHRRYAQGG